MTPSHSVPSSFFPPICHLCSVSQPFLVPSHTSWPDHSCLASGIMPLRSGRPGGRHRGRPLLVGSQRWAPNAMPSRSPDLAQPGPRPVIAWTCGELFWLSPTRREHLFLPHTVVTTGSPGSPSHLPMPVSTDKSRTHAGRDPASSVQAGKLKFSTKSPF